jgi:hypothetical protein
VRRGLLQPRVLFALRIAGDGGVVASLLNRVSLVLAGAGCLCGAGWVGAMWWEGIHTVSPSTANESAFMKSYSPEAVVHRFLPSGGSVTAEAGSSAGAGDRSATHTVDFEETFTMRSADETRLMSELRDDVERRLVAGRAQILNESGDAAGGFRFAYREGLSVGSVAISPLRAAEDGSSLSDGLVAVRLSVSAQERWLAAGRGQRGTADGD